MQPAAFTPPQLQAFYEHIKLPSPWRFSSIDDLHKAAESDSQPAALVAARKADGAPGAELALLERVMVHTMNMVPFENLSLHYSSYERIVLDEEILLEKVVGGLAIDDEDVSKQPPPAVKNGEPDLVDLGTSRKKVKNCRGGYCMENNLLFATVMRTIGFRVRTCGGRVFDPAAGLTAWAHMVNLVLIGGKKYVVDIGFGSMGPVRPLPLPSKQSSVARSERVWPEYENVAPLAVRYVRANPAKYFEPAAPEANGNGDKTQTEQAEEDEDDLDLWVYEIRPAPGQSWIPANCFTEIEFFANDYTIMSDAVSTARRSWFTYRVVCMRYVLRGDVSALCKLWREECPSAAAEEQEKLPYEDEDPGAAAREGKEQDIVGQLVLTEKVKLKVGGKSRVLEDGFKSEADRVAALKRWFGIQLSKSESRGIQCMVTAINEPALAF